MKKILITLLIGMSFVIGGCDWLGGGGDPTIIDPPKSPEFVLATVIPAVVEYNGSATIMFKVVNAKYVLVDGVKKGIEDSIKIPDLKSTTTINIVAFGEGDISSSRKITITVLPAPVLPNRTDTLCSKPMGYKSWDTFDKDGKLICVTNFSKEQLDFRFHFYPNGDMTRVDETGKVFPAKWSWGLEPNTINLGGTIYKYKLTPEYLITYLFSPSTGETQVITLWR